ncbi:hypothetical protein POL68_03065 [Stigmatella sp. ncwal1]|uniref:Uncharacterized protein n=1 Tax=Stigmatella ashevillensis TaxID=2995309 RepID=A0ABT5D196_9BACT|nr:hypothetical protein [Stigmatella ashevillena]MDC0707441.1 hypothetical protein [Stigmatella ashevillena]
MQPHITTLPLQSAEDRTRGPRIIANSLFRELVSHGYSTSQIIELTSELLTLLTASMRSEERERRAVRTSGGAMADVRDAADAHITATTPPLSS